MLMHCQWKGHARGQEGTQLGERARKWVRGHARGSGGTQMAVPVLSEGSASHASPSTRHRLPPLFVAKALSSGQHGALLPPHAAAAAPLSVSGGKNRCHVARAQFGESVPLSCSSEGALSVEHTKGVCRAFDATDRKRLGCFRVPRRERRTDVGQRRLSDRLGGVGLRRNTQTEGAGPSMQHKGRDSGVSVYHAGRGAPT